MTKAEIVKACEEASRTTATQLHDQLAKDVHAAIEAMASNPSVSPAEAVAQGAVAALSTFVVSYNQAFTAEVLSRLLASDQQSSCQSHER